MEMMNGRRSLLVLGLVALVIGGCRWCETSEGTSEGLTRVAVYVDDGARSMGVYQHLAIATYAKGVDGFPVDAEMIRAGALDGADVLVMPGGSSRRQLRALGREGGAKIAAFVARGGGYIGTCAGAFTVSQPTKDYPLRLGLLPVVSNLEHPDHADLNIVFTDEGAKQLGLGKKKWSVAYAGGPTFLPSAPVSNATASVVATYASDVNATDTCPRKPLFGTGAVVTGTYGKGRLFISAVHPEKDLANHGLLRAAFRHVSGRPGEWRFPRRRRGQLSVGVDSDASFGVKAARTLQDLMRADEFYLIPVNKDYRRRYGSRYLDVIIRPDRTTGAWEVKVGETTSTCADAAKLVARLRELAATPAPPPEPFPKKVAKPIRAAFYLDKGGACYSIAADLQRSPEFEAAFVSAEDVRKGCLKDFDLYLAPGGGCNTQYRTLREEGVAAITNFVYGGGRYYGICAGAFLATQTCREDYPRTGMVPFRHDNSPYRGGANIRLTFTPEGLEVFGNSFTNRSVYYGGGPVMVPGAPVPDTDIKVLARYSGESIRSATTNEVLPMAGKAALVGGRVGKGRVYVQAPHPEFEAATYDMVLSAVKYLTDVEPHVPAQPHVRGGLNVACRVRRSVEAANLFLRVLLPERTINWRLDSKARTSAGLRDLDVVLIPAPEKDDFDDALRAFVRSGGTALVLARTPEERRLADGWTGVTVVHSQDEILPALRRLEKPADPGRSAERAKVGVYAGPGATGVGVARWLQVAASSPELDAVCVERAEELDGLDLLVVPEGDAARMAAAFGADGAARLKAFVARGGACIGSGTGSRVLLRGDGGFGLVPFAVRQPETPRNATQLSTVVTEAGAALLGVKAGRRRVWYNCGPCLVPAASDASPAFVTAETFRGNVNPVSRESAPTMTGAASLVAGVCGEGRVAAVADNPEYNVETFDIVRGLLGWALRRKVGFALAQRRSGQLSAGFYCGGAIGSAAARAFVDLVRSGVADVELMDGGRVEEGRLRHLDALIVPDGVAVTGSQIDEFVRRGGRILAPEGAVEALRAATPARRKVVRTAVYADRGVSCAEFWNVSKLLSCSPNYDVTFVDRHDISNDVVNVRDFDLLLMSGGPIGVQELAVGASGRAAVTNFVRQGGAFYGICAGAFAMLRSLPNHPRFELLPFVNMPDQPYRGWCDMTMRFTADADELLGIPAGTRRTVLYWGGPVMVPAEAPEDSDIRVLATYEGDVVNTFAGGDIRSMSGCASIAGGRFGKGRLIASAIHPETSEATHDLVCGFLRYLTGREARPSYPTHEPGAVKVAFCMETATKEGMAFGMSLARDARFDVRPVTPYEVNQGLLDHTDVLFFPWPIQQGYMGLVHRFVERGGRVVEFDPEGKGTVKGARIDHVRTFDEARRRMLTPAN